MFFPWYLDPRNVSETSVLDDQAKEYFAKIKPRLDGIGVTLSEKQMRWWAAERRKQGIFMARENPSFLDECWSSPVKGAIYAEEIERARVEGRVGDFRPYEGALVHTSWDLGAPANTAVWYWQIVGREIRILDCDIGDFGTLTARVARMNAKGYLYGKHYLPHDAQTTERSGSNFTTELIAAGLPSPSLVTVPRCHSVWIGINHAKEMFSSLAFRMPNCEKGLDALSAYRKKVEGEGALSTSEPVHDWTSHPADAFRMMAEAHRAGLIAFKHTTAEPRPDWFGPKHKRRGAAPMKVSA
jgi:hypothetical protein